jgi:hypothetical protein
MYCLLWIAKKPQGQRGKGLAHDARIPDVQGGTDTLQVATARDSLLEMRLRWEKFPMVEENSPKPLVRSDKQQRILDALRQDKELFSQFACGV